LPYTADPDRYNETGLLVSKYGRLDKRQVRVIHNKIYKREFYKVYQKKKKREKKRICSSESKNVFHTRNISEIDPPQKRHNIQGDKEFIPRFRSFENIVC
jgi:hypothetical protein